MSVQDYLRDPRVVVRVKGVEFCNLPESVQNAVRLLEMHGCTAKHTVAGLLTVSSRDPYRPVAGLGLVREEAPERPRYSTERRQTGYYTRGERRYENTRWEGDR